eukprot:scaffold3421_cov187-Ochromonas_danica.AAC.4
MFLGEREVHDARDQHFAVEARQKGQQASSVRLDNHHRHLIMEISTTTTTTTSATPTTIIMEGQAEQDSSHLAERSTTTTTTGTTASTGTTTSSTDDVINKEVLDLHHLPLNEDLYHHIFSFLDNQSLHHVACVSRSFHHLVQPNLQQGYKKWQCKQSRKFSSKIQHILRYDWNPINHAQLPIDEYDYYVLPILQFLLTQKNATVADITTFLKKVEIRAFGGAALASDRARQLTAQKLLQFKLNQVHIEMEPEVLNQIALKFFSFYDPKQYHMCSLLVNAIYCLAENIVLHPHFQPSRSNLKIMLAAYYKNYAHFTSSQLEKFFENEKHQLIVPQERVLAIIREARPVANGKGVVGYNQSEQLAYSFKCNTCRWQVIGRRTNALRKTGLHPTTANTSYLKNKQGNNLIDS